MIHYVKTKQTSNLQKYSPTLISKFSLLCPYLVQYHWKASCIVSTSNTEYIICLPLRVLTIQVLLCALSLPLLPQLTACQNFSCHVLTTPLISPKTFTISQLHPTLSRQSLHHDLPAYFLPLRAFTTAAAT